MRRCGTSRNSRRHPPIYYDEEQHGFFVLCHLNSKTYYVQHDIAGKSVMVSIARTTDMTAAQARRQAAKHIVDMRNGINPYEARKKRNLETLAKADVEGFTLDDAVKLYMENSERSAKTDSEYRRIFNSHLNPYLNKPLVWLAENQHLIKSLHSAISRNGYSADKRKGRKKGKPAPYAANGMFRAFRAVYNEARKRKEASQTA